MISQLRGILLEKEPTQLLMEVNGVGYEIEAPVSTLQRLPEIGAQLLLHTHFNVREDAQQLFGFFSKEERTLFRTLLKVNGVGPKLALTILSSMEPHDFAFCVANNDAARLVGIPGVGKKTAERLIIEMRDKLTHLQPTEIAMKSDKTSPRHQILQDAVSALVSLGYKPQEATRVIAKIDDGNFNSEEMIRRALQERIS